MRTRWHTRNTVARRNPLVFRPPTNLGIQEVDEVSGSCGCLRLGGGADIAEERIHVLLRRRYQEADATRPSSVPTGSSLQYIELRSTVCLAYKSTMRWLL